MWKSQAVMAHTLVGTINCKNALPVNKFQISEVHARTIRGNRLLSQRKWILKLNSVYLLKFKLACRFYKEKNWQLSEEFIEDLKTEKYNY